MNQRCPSSSGSITGQKLVDRRHLGAQVRDARREVFIGRGTTPEATSAVLAAQLFGTMTTLSQDYVKAKRRMRVQQALSRLKQVLAGMNEVMAEGWTQ